MIGDTSNFLALAVKPVDVATPLMQAAKIRQSQMEEQQQTIQMHRDAIGAEARGLAPLVGSPDYEQARQASTQRLGQMGILNSPQAQAGWEAESSSPLGIKSIIARTNPPAMALQEKQLEESQRHAKVTEGQSAATLAETTRQHNMENMKPVVIGEGLSGPIYGVRNPKAPGGYDILDAKALRAAQQAGGASPEPAPDAGAVPGAGVGAAPGGGVPGSAGAGGAVTTPGTQPKPAAAVRGGPSPADLAIDAKAGRNMQYLASLEPDEQQLIRKVANYEVNPQSLSIKGGHRERILTAAANYDPSYDQKNYNAYSAGLKAFGASKEGAAVRSFNVGIEHLDQLSELGAALKNGDIPKINALSNWVKTNLGQDAPTNFNGLKAIVGAEIVKAIVGMGGTGEERAQAAKTVNDASSPEQLAGIVKTYQKAMGAQLGGLQRQYEQSTGRKDFDRLLSPQAIRARDSHSAATSPVNDIQALGDARTAIAKGAPREAVEKRLKEKGIKYNPADLDLQ